MKNFRVWSKAPYRVAVVHGGPGTPGFMATVARELAKNTSVLEPLQTKNSIDGQVEELAEVLKKHADIPVILIGHSWGATLSCITAASHPDLIRKLILIGTVPPEEKGSLDNTPTLLDRLSEAERVKFLALAKLVWNGSEKNRNETWGRFTRLIVKAETYAPLPIKDEVLQYQLEINQAIGLEICRLLEDGELVKAVQQITCPVTAISGDYDPRLAEKVRASFKRMCKDFRFILLEKCGHVPWIERYARDQFFKVLREEIA